jgi:hypothetical protein
MKQQQSHMKKPPTSAMLEQHYTPAQLAKRWGFSDDFVRELFRGEEGVMQIDRPEKMHKRGYVTLRIPESVAERVYARLVSKRPTSTDAVRSAQGPKVA